MTMKAPAASATGCEPIRAMALLLGRDVTSIMG
jgi:hypothetical protein